MDNDARLRLEDVLDREIGLGRALATNLAAERHALTGESPGAIQEQAADKIRLLGAIERLEGERRTLWGATHVPGLGPTIAARWRTLMVLMAGCRMDNEINGHIIRVRQHQVGQLIDIVRGGPSVTYGPRGKTFAKPLRALARA